MSTYYTAFKSAENAYESALGAADQSHAGAVAAANAAYDAAVAPYQLARDQAQANYDANPSDAAAQTALNDADAALNSAIASASDDRDTANNDAAITYQVALDLSEENLFDAQAPLITAFDASTVGADPAYAAAGTTAWDLYLVAKANADAAVVQAEDTAWTLYLSALFGQQSSLVAPDSFIQAQFDAQVAVEFSVWQASEQTAWSSYTTNMANVPNAPALGQPILAPTPVVFAAVAPFPGLLNGVRQQLVLAALAPRIQSFSPFLGLVIAQGVAVPLLPGQHYIPIKVLNEFSNRLDLDAIKLALGWFSGQTSPHHGNTTIIIDSVTITHPAYSKLVSAEMTKFRTLEGITGRMFKADMEKFIRHIEGLPDTHHISLYNRGIGKLRDDFMAANQKAPAPPVLTDDRIKAGKGYLGRISFLLLTAAAWDAIGGQVRVLALATDENSDFIRAVGALAAGNIVLAQQYMGEVGGSGFIGKLQDELGFRFASPFQDKWQAAVDSALESAAAINNLGR